MKDLILKCNCGCSYMELVFVPEHLEEPWADVSVCLTLKGGDAFMDRLSRAKDLILNERAYLREVLLRKEEIAALHDYLGWILQQWPEEK